MDHFKFLQTMLATQNYEGIFFPKPDSPCLYITENNGPDGCALFYKKTKFDLVNYDTRVLEVWRVQSNQVTITANLRVIETGKEICVCTTHLKARNGALLAKLRNEQGKVSKIPTVASIYFCLANKNISIQRSKFTSFYKTKTNICYVNVI